MNGVKNMFKNYTKGKYSNSSKSDFTIKSKNKKHRNRLAKKTIHSMVSNDLFDFIKSIEDHNQPINNIISLDGLNFITSDNNEFYIRTLENNETLKDNFGKNSKIHKIIYSLGKIIFSVEYFNQINGNNEKGVYFKLNLAISMNNQIKLFSCNINNNPNIILESDNVIITAGKNFIELFQFNQNNNNNPLLKVSEIKFNNSDNDNDEKYNILSMKTLGKILICGHGSGHISFWRPINESPYLQSIFISRIHIGPINEIIFDKNSENSDILISCSSDKTVKIHSIEDTICFKVINFEEEVINIKKIFNPENEANYIISLKNGILKVFNSLFKEIWEIPSRSNTNNTIRLVVNINNSNNNENTNKGNYLLISEENKIIVYKLNKKEEKEEETEDEKEEKKVKEEEKVNKFEKEKESNISYKNYANTYYYNKNIYGKKKNYKSSFFY